MNTLLYKLQIAGYDNREYWRLVPKATTGTVKVTARIRRLRVAIVVVCVLSLGLPCCWLAHTVAWVNRLLWPYERHVHRKLIRRAQRKLRRMPQLIKIGITGSYGKTSVKNILTAFLQTKYRVVDSPHSFNTPLGLARTINEHLTADTQVLIMEMGARRPGEIRELCQLFGPQHGIITSIGPCHLQTFGSVERVAQTKAELFAALPPDGIAVSDGAQPWCAQFKHPHLILVPTATTPDYPTPLLGQHQQTNLKLAAAMARSLGVDESTIRHVAAHLTPTPHRLEKIVAPNGVIILDDSYNANPDSATAALHVLAGFPGRKVVQTPGLVEQGEQQIAAHQTLAGQITRVADAVIVVGTLNRDVLLGALQNFRGPVHWVPNRDAAKPLYAQLLRPGDVLLLLNDLPEQY